MYQKCSLLDCITRGTFEHAEILFVRRISRQRYDNAAENGKVFSNADSNIEIARSEKQMVF